MDDSLPVPETVFDRYAEEMQGELKAAKALHPDNALERSRDVTRREFELTLKRYRIDFADRLRKWAAEMQMAADLIDPQSEANLRAAEITLREIEESAGTTRRKQKRPPE